MQRETGGALTRPKVKAPDPAELELGAPRCSRGRAAALRGPGQGSLPHAAVPPRRRAQSIGKAPGRPQQGQGGSGIALTPVPVVQGLHVTVFHGFAEPFPKGPASQDHFSRGCAQSDASIGRPEETRVRQVPQLLSLQPRVQLGVGVTRSA